MLAGMLPVIAGMAWLAQVSAGTSYLGGILGPMLLLGTGMGVVFVPLTTVSLAGVAAADSGAASSMVNVMQQLGGALGLAILVTVFGTAYRHAAAAGHRPAPSGALVHGVAAAFTVAAVFDGCALLVILLTSGRTELCSARPGAQRGGDHPQVQVGGQGRARVHDRGRAAVRPGRVRQSLGRAGHHGRALQQGQVEQDGVVPDAAVGRRGQHHIAAR